MEVRRRLATYGTYRTYAIGCVVAWLLVLLVTERTADASRRHAVLVTCAGWWVGWLSATIARHVYPPPARWQTASR